MTRLRTPALRTAPSGELEFEDFGVERLVWDESQKGSEQLRVSQPEILQGPDDGAWGLVGVEGQEVGNLYLVRMRVHARYECGTIDVTGSGSFFAPPEREDLVYYNAPALALGMIRGVISTVTGLVASERLDIPSVNVAELINGQ